MRLAACAAVSLLVIVAAACNGGDGGGNGTATWDGPPTPDESGSVAVEDFAAHQEEVDEPWERSAETAAAEFLRLDERTSSRTTIDGSSTGGEGTGPRVVIVTLDGLLDDSVRTEQWQLRFEQDEDGYTLSSAVRTLRCQPGRGHQEFSAEPCT